jgi:hypothetical protein
MANIENRIKALERQLLQLEEYSFDLQVSFVRPGDMAVTSVLNWVSGKWVETVYIPEEYNAS